jgi:hypothetical protein
MVQAFGRYSKAIALEMQASVPDPTFGHKNVLRPWTGKPLIGRIMHRKQSLTQSQSKASIASERSIPDLRPNKISGQSAHSKPKTCGIARVWNDWEMLLPYRPESHGASSRTASGSGSGLRPTPSSHSIRSLIHFSRPRYLWNRFSWFCSFS